MYILTYDLCLGLFDIAMTIESARASSNWSCRCSCVLAAARCALFAAALASRSARSLPYTPTCAGTCLNSTLISASAKADSARFMTFHKSAFSSRRPPLVHPSASQRGNHLLMPSIQSRLSLRTTRSLNSFGQAMALRTARMIAVSSARLLVCFPGGIALILKSDLSPNQTPLPAPHRPLRIDADPSV